MRKVSLLVILSFIFILAGCAPAPQSTQLTIGNATGYPLELVNWNGYYFENDSVWDVDGYYPVLLDGTSVTRNVNPGTKRISFYYVNNTTKYFTYEVITVPSGQHMYYTFTDYSISSLSVTESTNSIADKKAELLESK